MIAPIAMTSNSSASDMPFLDLIIFSICLPPKRVKSVYPHKDCPIRTADLYTYYMYIGIDVSIVFIRLLFDGILGF